MADYVPITDEERDSHSFVSLNGEDWACFYCDSKTGRGICPGDGTQYADDYSVTLGSKADRGEADQILEGNQATYEAEPEDSPF